MEQILVNLLNGLSAGLLLFMLGAGLTLIFSMMGVLNFAHAGFYMLGAYVGLSISHVAGFWVALGAAPLLVGGIGAGFERACLRRLHRHGPVAELLATFGLGLVLLELVQLAWGRAPVPFEPPPLLAGPAFTLVRPAGGGLGVVAGRAAAGLCEQAACVPFPATRAFVMVAALAMLLALWLLLHRTRIGLVIRAALTHPRMAEALGHDVPRLFTGVFGAGCGLAAAAGVIGGVTFLTEPAMAATIGPVLFVAVVVGGIGSLAGAFVGAVLVGLLQTLPLTIDLSLLDAGAALGWTPDPASAWRPLLAVTLAQAAPILPYLLLVVVLLVRPRGLLGARDG